MLVGLFWKLDQQSIIEDVRKATLAYKRRMIGQPVYVVFNAKEAPPESEINGLQVVAQSQCLKGHIIVCGGDLEQRSRD